MTSIDWTAKATLQQRDDSGSDMFYAFKDLGAGPLAEMIDRVLRMPPHDRARIVLDVRGVGMLDINQVVELSLRPDYPHS